MTQFHSICRSRVASLFSFNEWQNERIMAVNKVGLPAAINNQQPLTITPAKEGEMASEILPYPHTSTITRHFPQESSVSDLAGKRTNGIALLKTRTQGVGAEVRAKDARLGVSFLAIEQRCSDPDQKDWSRDEIEEIFNGSFERKIQHGRSSMVVPA
jgi:hypothetical protein